MGKLDDKVEYLDDERKKLWVKLTALEKKQFIVDNDLLNVQADVKNKTSDYEDTAKQASRKASEFRNKSEDAKNSAIQHLEEARLKNIEIVGIHAEADSLRNTIIVLHDNSIDKKDEIETIHTEVTEHNDLIADKVAQLNAMFESIPSYEVKIEKLDAVLSKSEDYLLKNEAIYKSISTRKKEIDELYYEIVGFTDTNDAGEETEVTGLKDELETSYDQLQSSFLSTQKEINDFKSKSISDYNQFTTTKATEYNEVFSSWESGYAKALKDIDDLMPNALTAGLSHAYSKKKESEVLESGTIALKFEKAIRWMVYVSLIPFVISIISWLTNKELDKVLLDMPRLVLSILPLYIPVLWLAYSSNKSLKLSKRLIEEYTHKEVLSRTFEGLSKQIGNLGESDVAIDLRIKLLYNLLEVNSENPGKLITDYNKSDHPLMDALDKSIKLSNAVDKLAEIPGLSKLAKVLDNKSKRIIKEKDVKANAGLNILSKNPKEDEEEEET